MSSTTAESPSLLWDAAAGYDFFASLHVLHAPDLFALRGAWAKGVRARLPAKVRPFLEDVSPLLLGALPWVYALAPPKDGQTILNALAAVPPQERFRALMNTGEIPPTILSVLDRIAGSGGWTEQDRTEILSLEKGYKESSKELDKMLDLWARAGELGEKALEALTAYYEVFFAEEEQRILPALDQAVARGQEMAAEMPFAELVAELSEGIRFDEEELAYKEWLMVPSFWITPRILMSRMGPDRGVFFYGGRPAEASLVPGAAVPDALYLALKALADPTRLRILHYLEEQPQTPSELAKTLRLRAPTVIHHLNSLRLAGLVYVAYGKGDKRYASRTSRIAEMHLQLRRYLGISELKRIKEVTGRPPYMA